MAVTTLTATALVKDVASVDLKIAGATAIDASKTMEVDYPIEGKLLLCINNTYAGAKVVTVTAGGFNAAGKGDLAISIAQDAVEYIVLSSDRFKTTGGKVSLSFAASTTGFVLALTLP